MAVSKFRIYDYWKDKAITKKFEIKPVSACTKEDDAMSRGISGYDGREALFRVGPV